jgi:hypothetical protein
MRFELNHSALIPVLVLGFVGCGGAGSEPSQAQMKDAMAYAMNHPPGETVSDPITIAFFKKEACEPPTAQGYKCTFEVKVESRNSGASIYNNLPFAEFYKDTDSGNWTMRPPF